jgi:NADPH:quinone reductase-like Zn-dependent oxidoreductase
MNFMKAMIWTAYGAPDVLQLREVDKPTPKHNEVLIKVRAATVTIADCEMRGFAMPGWIRFPLRVYSGVIKPSRIKILGQELSGEIEAVGSDVTRFKAGDSVFASTGLRLGAYAQYACLPASNLVTKPTGLTFEEAATIPTGGINGLYFLKSGEVQAGQSVLLNGAGGSIGTYAVQIAKAIGAKVTAVDSADKLEMLRSIGADHVIDYTRENFTQNGETYDVIIDIVGKSSFSRCIESLKPNGRYVLGNPNLSGMLRARWTPMRSGKKVVVAFADYTADLYAQLIGWIEMGKLKPMIDRCYPLEHLAEAHRYVETGHKKGNVVITVRSND